MALFSDNSYLNSFSNYLKPKTPPKPPAPTELFSFANQQSLYTPTSTPKQPFYPTPTGAPVDMRKRYTPPPAPKTIPTGAPKIMPAKQGLFFEVGGKKLYSPSGQKYDAIPAEQAPGYKAPLAPPIESPTKEPSLTGDDFKSYYEELSGKKALEQAEQEREVAKKTEQTAFETGQTQIKGLIESSQKMFSDLFNSPEMAEAKKFRGEAYASIQRIDAEEAQALNQLKQQQREKGVVSWASFGQQKIVSEGFNAQRAGELAKFAIANDAYDQGFKYAEQAYSANLSVLNSKIGLVQNIIDRAKTLSDDEKNEYKDVLAQAKELYKNKKSEQKESTDLYIQLAQKGIDGISPTMSVAEMSNVAGPEIIKQAKQEMDLKTEKTYAEIKKIQADTEKINQTKKDLEGAGVSGADTLADKVVLIDSLKDHAGLNSRVGPTWLGRRAFAAADKFGSGQDFAGGVQNLVSKETIDALISLKARGGTLGALSDQERVLLQTAATRIGAWELRDEQGFGKGEWNISESAFKKELETIKTLTKKAITKALGYDPSTIKDSDAEDISNLYGKDMNPATFY